MTIHGARLRRTARLVLLIAGLAVVIWLAWSARADVAQLLATIKPGWSAVALVLGVGLNVLQAVLFSILLRKHGTHGAMSKHIKTYLLSLAGKYLPGGIWAAVAQASALSAPGAVRSVLLVNIELAFINVMLLIGIGVACLPSLTLFAICVVAFATFSILTLAIRQQAIAILLNIFARRFPRLRISVPAEVAAAPSWLSAAGLALAMLILCASTSAAVIFASGQATLREIPTMVALVCLGWTAGLIAIPVPAGVGVREASTLALWTALPNTFARGAVIAIMLLVRVWQLAVDLLSFALAMLIHVLSSDRRRT